MIVSNKYTTTFYYTPSLVYGISNIPYRELERTIYPVEKRIELGYKLIGTYELTRWED